MRRIFLCVLLMSSLTACSNYTVGRSDFRNHEYKSAFARLLPVAKEGNAKAQYAVGYMYYTGQGVTHNFKEALYWMRQAAAQHEPNAVKAVARIEEAQNTEPFPPPAGVTPTDN